jgi:hypothetical protein
LLLAAVDFDIVPSEVRMPHLRRAELYAELRRRRRPNALSRPGALRTRARSALWASVRSRFCSSPSS